MLKMKKWFSLFAATLLLVSLSTVAWCDEQDVIVEAGQGYEILDVTVGQKYDETYGQIETLTIVYAPVESAVDATAEIILGASMVFLAAMAWARRRK